VAQIASSRVLNLRYDLSTPQQLEHLLRRGQISAALVVPADFEARLERRDRPPLQLVVDASDQSVQSSARQLAAYPLPGWNNPTGIQLLNLYNPERLAPINTVPGLIGVILTMTIVLFAAIALVREREHGNMEMLIATPLSPWELTLARTYHSSVSA
jgi:ABC-2 type transport system permease protein